MEGRRERGEGEASSVKRSSESVRAREHRRGRIQVWGVCGGERHTGKTRTSGFDRERAKPCSRHPPPPTSTLCEHPILPHTCACEERRGRSRRGTTRPPR